jgi:cytidylate kinase
MIVTIDGPAGSGKTSAARGLAARLGFEVLDTGAMYRAVAVAALRAAVSVDDRLALAALLERTSIEMPPGHVLLNGEDVSLAIRTPEVSQSASKVASVRVVREFLVGLQRAIASGRDMVCEGRDQGTVVFPSADCKFFLQAGREERARRRLAEIHDRGSRHVTFEEVLAQQEERDRRDASRDLAPMTAAADAKVIDTTDLTPDEVLDLLEREVRRCLPV